MKKFFSDFKKFITRGNVFDLAVGMIIATAFNKIVSSLVNDIILKVECQLILRCFLAYSVGETPKCFLNILEK